MKTTVSVVIPTYNRLYLLDACLESVFMQSSNNIALDVILVDDGSSDGTIDRFSKDKRLRYVYKINGGVSSARNVGIQLAEGEFIAFLDSDDRWLPRKIEKQLEYLKCGNFDAVLSDVLFIDNNGHTTGRILRRNNILEDGSILRYIVKSPYLVPSSLLCRRDVFEKIGNFDENIQSAEDIDFFLRLASKCQIGILKKPLVCCICGRSDGISRSSKTYDNHFMVMQRFFERDGCWMPKREKRNILSNIMYESAKNFTYYNECILAREKIIAAIKLYPNIMYCLHMLKNEIKNVVCKYNRH